MVSSLQKPSKTSATTKASPTNLTWSPGLDSIKLLVILELYNNMDKDFFLVEVSIVSSARVQDIRGLVNEPKILSEPRNFYPVASQRHWNP